MSKGKYVFKCVIFMDSGTNPAIIRMEGDSPHTGYIAEKIVSGGTVGCFNGFDEWTNDGKAKRQVFVNIGKIESINIECVSFNY